jgi:hypothetical protein
MAFVDSVDHTRLAFAGRTTTLTCRGRLERHHTARRRNGGPGRLQRLDNHHGLGGMGGSLSHLR